MFHLLFCGLLHAQATRAPAPDSIPDSVTTTAVRIPTAASVDTGERRPHAVELSDWYDRRLFVHRWGSYVELPLFGAEYILGNKLITSPVVSQSVKHEHLAVAVGLGALFTVNTVTGAWNLLSAWPSADDHRALVLTHTALMLSSDAGFAIAGALGQQSNRRVNVRNAHRAVAVGSMGLATIGTGMMWLWNNHD